MNKREHHIVCAIYARLLQCKDKLTPKDEDELITAIEYILPACDRIRIRNADQLAREISQQL